MTQSKLYFPLSNGVNAKFSLKYKGPTEWKDFFQLANPRENTISGSQRKLEGKSSIPKDSKVGYVLSRKQVKFYEGDHIHLINNTLQVQSIAKLNKTTIPLGSPGPFTTSEELQRVKSTTFHQLELTHWQGGSTVEIRWRRYNGRWGLWFMYWNLNRYSNSRYHEHQPNH